MRARSFLLFLLLLSGWAMAQYPMVRAIEVRPGQQRPRITMMAQDERGLIWTASDAGLMRTDGEVVEVMARFEGARITALAAEGASMLAALSTGVIMRCRERGCDTLLVDPAFVANRVTGLVADGAGTVWIGTYGAGLWRWQDGRPTKWNEMNGLPDGHVNAIAALPDGSMAVATDQGLAVCNGERITALMGEAEGAPDNLVLAIAVDQEGLIWAGCDRKGVFQWRPGEPALAIAQPWPFGAVHDVAVSGGMVWAGTREHGAVVVDLALEHGTYRMEEPGLPALRMMRDADGAVWWCDGSEALHRADPAILIVPEHEGLDLRGITALCADARQSIWFATEQGVHQHVAWFSEERTVARLPVRTDARAPVVALAASPDGTVWAATFGAGVSAIAPDGSVAHYDKASGLSNDNVLGARATSEGAVFATLEGVTIAWKGSMQRAAGDAGFTFDALMHDGRLLVATDGKGIRSAAPDSPVSDEQRKGTFYSLLRDSSGRFWAIGPGTGFCRADDASQPCIAAGLPPFDGDLYALGEVAGHLIAFGSTGVLALDPGTGDLFDVTTAFGLNDITAGLNCIAPDAQGALWFACSKGLVRLRPQAAHFRKALSTTLLLTEVAGEAIDHTHGLRLVHDRSSLVLRFTATHWADPAAVRFQYRLRGFGEDIVDTRDRQAAFPALPPGSYTFQVRAFAGAPDADAPWTELAITVTPPWWRLPWVLVLFLIVALGIAFAVIRARDRRLRFRDRMEQEKVRFQLEALRSQVDPHFLFNSFNALVELIESEPGKAVEHVEQLSTFFRNILQVRDQERITVEEELRLLATYFALEQRRFGSSIALQVDVDAASRTRAIVPLTLQLLVENALKHNVVIGAAPFMIDIASEGDSLVVTNPIRPRATPARSTGFGLESITKRYAALTSRPIEVLDGERRFRVRIPLIDPQP